MFIKNIKTNEIGTKFEFDKERRVCRILDEAGDTLTSIDTNIAIIDDYAPSDYSVILLYNGRDNCTEESIFQVKKDDHRVGWLFPVQAIHSNEHSYSDNEHFLKYAYIAWVYILNKCKIEINEFSEFDLFCLYNDECNFLVLCKENCDSIGFDYEKYVVSLFEYGYSEKGHGNIFTSDKKIEKSLKLQSISPELGNISVINTLFRNQIASETNSVSRFYIYYQLIEIMISRIFEYLFQIYIDGFKGESVDLFEKKMI